MHKPPLNEDEKRPLLQPNPYPKNNIRLKLLALIGMLGLVIFAMYEAGKPENWEWMGFKEDAEIRLDTNGDRVDDAAWSETAIPDQPETAKQPTTERSAPTSSDSPKSISLVNESANRTSQSILNRSVADTPIDYPPAAIRFWEESYPELNRDSQKALMQLLKEIRTGRPPTKRSVEDTQRMLNLLARRRADFHQELFDKLTLTPDSSPNKTSLSERYHASESIWQSRTLPALVAAAKGEPITDEHQKIATELQRVLDQLAYQQVEDKTTIGWVGDSEAWLRIWEQVVSEQLDNPCTPVKRIQLIGQPASFRGKHIEISGTVLSGRKETLPEDSAIGIKQRYELWLRPDGSGAGPYCLYAIELPEGFPELNETFKSIEEPISAKGMFFKVRSFNSAGGDVDYSPVVICKSFRRSAQASQKQAAESQGIPWTWLIAATLALPFVAGLVAWMASRLAEVDRHQPGKVTQGRIENSLQVLKEDPNIETDIERVQRLGQLLDESENANVPNAPNENA